MLNLKCLVQITTKKTGIVYSFDFTTEIQIKNTWQDYTDTATVVMPRKISLEGKNITAGSDSLFTRGDSIQIYLGYAPVNYDPTVDPKTYLLKEFDGYVTRIKPQVPIEIECEDPMWLLKLFRMTNTFREGSNLQDVMDYFSVQYKAWAARNGYTRKLTFKGLATTKLGALAVGDNMATCVDVFEHFRKMYGFVSFVRDDVVYCGFAYKDFNAIKNYSFSFGDDIISSDLEYKNKGDVPFQVTAKTLYTVNKKKILREATVGDGDGAKNILPFYGNFSYDQLKSFAQRELDKLSFTGFYGSFETFGEPSLRYWDRVTIGDLTNNSVPDRNGVYLIKQVDKTFGINGFRQKVQLDIKIG